MLRKVKIHTQKQENTELNIEESVIMQNSPD